MSTSSSGDPAAVGSEYYEKNYPDYVRQNSPGKIAFYMDLVRRWVPRGGRLFELGVGLGVFLEAAVRDFEVWGCDINEFGVKETGRRVPGARLSVGSHECLDRVPAPAGVVAWDVLEHVPDLRAALVSIHRHLQPGGVLIAVVPVYDGPLGWLVTALDKDTTHVSKWGRGQWLETLRACGFEVVEWGGIIRRLLGGRWYMHLTRPQGVLRPIGSALYYVARKQGTAS